MPAKQVFQYTCDRCQRVWYEDKEVKTASIEVTFFLKGAEKPRIIKLPCLCDSCEKTTGNYVDGIAKVMKKPSPKRGAKRQAREPEPASDD